MKVILIALALIVFLPIYTYANYSIRLTTYLEIDGAIIPIIEDIAITRHIEAQAVAYSPEQEELSDYTFSGLPLVAGLAAVDPSVIPLGTYIYVSGHGIFLAADIGSAIQGYMVDLAFDTIAEALQFGRRTVDVFILDRVTDLF